VQAQYLEDRPRQHAQGRLGQAHGLEHLAAVELGQLDEFGL
jgi:hypothetical protein